MGTLTFDDLRNNTELTFKDISSEKSRKYRFPKDEVVEINEPVALNVSRTGGHRILDSKGESHYVSSGWIQLSWVAKDDQPHFVA